MIEHRGGVVDPNMHLTRASTHLMMSAKALVPTSINKISNNLLMAIIPSDNYSLKSIPAEIIQLNSHMSLACGGMIATELGGAGSMEQEG